MFQLSVTFSTDMMGAFCVQVTRLFMTVIIALLYASFFHLACCVPTYV
jgi:hypothetical protein